jgi:hypothetical protein
MIKNGSRNEIVIVREYVIEVWRRYARYEVFAEMTLGEFEKNSLCVINARLKLECARNELFSYIWPQQTAKKEELSACEILFKSKLEDVLKTNRQKKIQDARKNFSEALNTLEQADKEFRDLLDLVINSVRGNHAYGADSSLYRALGYVPRSERASGLTRKRKSEENTNQMSQKENDAA